MARADVVGAAMIEGTAASRRASSNLGMRHSIVCEYVAQWIRTHTTPTVRQGLIRLVKIMLYQR